MNRNASERVSLSEELPMLRTTAMAQFRDCPKRWQAEHTESDSVDVDDEEEGTEFTRRGTAVHEACTAVLGRVVDPTDVEDWEVVDKRLKSAGVPPAERQNAHDYCCELKARLDDTERWRLVACEARFVRLMVPGAPPVKGTPDAIWMDLEEACYVIQDHKTNRRWEHSDEWRLKLQPRTYTWAIRQALQSNNLFGGASPRIDFEIGYVNLGGSVRWTTTVEEDEGVVREFADLWQELQVYRRTGEWPERVNAYCSSCPLLYDCGAARRLWESVAGMEGLAMDGSDGNEVTLENLARVKSAIKVAEALEERIAEQVRARVECAGGPVREGEWVAVLQPRSKREAAFGAVHDAWMSTPISELENTVLEESQDEVFSVRLGALDRVVKRVPALGTELAGRGVIQSVEQAPQLVVRLARPGE